MTSTDIKTIELIVNSEQAKKRLDELNQRLTTMKQKREVFWRKASAEGKLVFIMLSRSPKVCKEALNKGDSRGLQVYTIEIQNYHS
ncbi:MAG: hypothetical protein ILA34_00580 [Bacteroidaceae bacterium]|nr:hypothetical protein [Bacteroidaceae bacterium]